MADTWRFIDTGSCPAAYNMALDEAIAVAVRQDLAPPTLRVYGWVAPSLSIGCFQRAEDIDSRYCSEKQIPIVRRPTGGRGILHGNEMTYSFSAKTTSGLFSKGLLDSYKRISSAIGLALTKAGLSPELKLMKEMKRSSVSSGRVNNPFCFRSISFGEISVNGKKIVGSAQKRWPDGLLQQGSIPFLVDEDEIVKIFRLDYLREIEESMTGLREISPELDYGILKEALRISFEEVFEVKFIFSYPSVKEVSLAREMEVQKYLSNEWTFGR